MKSLLAGRGGVLLSLYFRKIVMCRARTVDTNEKKRWLHRCNPLLHSPHNPFRFELALVRPTLLPIPVFHQPHCQHSTEDESFTVYGCETRGVEGRVCR
ncbi:hypothetical protein F5B17DRAFT_78801 [Nemania serpens]|nr:hypothetical protein F5B17DRAFT_78801 [Nemania serpens]